MDKENLSFEDLPKEVLALGREIDEVKKLLTLSVNSKSKARVPISIDEASELIQKAKPTIYTLVRKGIIPSCKRGKQLYFFEDELLAWIEEGRKPTYDELMDDLDNQSAEF